MCWLTFILLLFMKLYRKNWKKSYGISMQSLWNHVFFLHKLFLTFHEASVKQLEEIFYCISMPRYDVFFVISKISLKLMFPTNLTSISSAYVVARTQKLHAQFRCTWHWKPNSIPTYIPPQSDIIDTFLLKKYYL